MRSLPVPTAARRIAEKLGAALLWAAGVGAVLAALTFYRPGLNVSTKGWYHRVLLSLERLEWASYDSRSRALADAEHGDEAVVWASVDRESVLSAHEAHVQALASSPWPRWVYGRLAEQALREGATRVVLDVPLSTPSPYPRGAPDGGSDDACLRETLMRLGDKVITTVPWSQGLPVRAERELRPFRVRLGKGEKPLDLFAPAQFALDNGGPTFVFPTDGGFELWAATESEDSAARLSVRGGVLRAVTEPVVPEDSDFEIGREWLWTVNGGVSVEHAPPSRTVASDVETPAASLFFPGWPLGAIAWESSVDGKTRAVAQVVALERVGHSATLMAAAPLRVLMAKEDVDSVSFEDGAVVVGSRRIPMESDGTVWLKWNLPEPKGSQRRTVANHVPAWHLWQNANDETAGHVLRRHDNGLEGKVVVISEELARESLVDTPVGPVVRGAALAQAVDNVLRGEVVARSSSRDDARRVGLMAVMGSLMAVAVSSLSRRPGWLFGVVPVVAVGASYVAWSRTLFLDQRLWVAQVGPLLALALSYFGALGYAESLERRFLEGLRRILGRAVNAEVLARVQRNVGLMRPERRDVAVVFVDIDGFTEATADREASEVVGLIQGLLGRFTDIVVDGQGHVDKYLGDGLMAFWGAPVSLGNSSERACAAALNMKKAFEKDEAEWRRMLGKSLKFSAGISFGPVVAGEMGTEHRVAYSVIGPTVTRAARLEKQCQQAQVGILVSAQVAEQAKDSFQFRLIEGATAPAAYELLGPSVAA